MPTAQEKLLLKTAERILKTSLAAQLGEKFLTITDLETHPIGRAFFETGFKVGTESVLTVIKERTRHEEESPPPAARAWENSDVYIEEETSKPASIGWDHA
jgi:hypothetical protein